MTTIRASALLTSAIVAALVAACGSGATAPSPQASAASALSVGSSSIPSAGAGSSAPFGPGHTFAPPPSHPAVSPRAVPADLPAGWIAFSRWENDAPTVHIVRLDGSDDHPVGPGTSAAWRPDGQALLMTIDTTDGRVEGEVVGLDGSPLARLGPVDAGLSLRPGAWSPDGTRIAFGGWDDGDAHRSGIYVGASTGGGQLRRVTSVEGAMDSPIAWSADGSRILFARSHGDGDAHALYVVDPDGSGLVQVAGEVSLQFADSAAVSPDGGRVAYVVAGGSWKGEPTSSVVVFNVRTGERTRVWSGPGPTAVGWSPDGTKLVFDEGYQGGVRLLVLDPTNENGIDAGGDVVSQSDALRGCCGRWSPDGAWLLAVSMGSLQIVHPDGSERTTVTSGVSGRGGAWAAWQP